jgi:cell division protein FtsQ
VSIVVGCVLGMSAVLIFAYDLITQSDYFNLRHIHIAGVHRLSEQEIADHARIQKGINLFSVNLPLAKKRLENHPWIAGAEIKLKPPDRLEINIEEHRAVAFINLDRMYVLNQNGFIFKEKSIVDLLRLPVVRGLDFSDVHVPGKPRSRPFLAVMEVLSMGKKLGAALPNEKIDEIHVDREMGVRLYASKSRMTINLGYSDYPQKYARLKRVLSHLHKHKEFGRVESIDLNNKKRIVMKPIKPAETGDEKKEV